MKHISVLLNESITSLNLQEDSIVVDATLGYAGHSSEILKRVKKGWLYSFDQDQTAIEASQKRLSEIGNNYTIIKSNFVNMKKELAKKNIEKVDAILFDLGVSSPQLDDKMRGFSYHEDAKLDMRMDQSQPFSAYELVNTYSEVQLMDIFFRYGEDKFSKSIAKKIIEARNEKPIETTLELVEIIKRAVPERARREKHPARQIFQAIRIEVNHELDILEQSMIDALSLLNKNGRLSVITFHSLEDRIIKEIFKKVTMIDPMVKGLPVIPEEYQPDFKLITQKPIKPSKYELELNNRARSSKLRVIERIK